MWTRIQHILLLLSSYRKRVEQDHRGVKRLVNPGMGFGSFNSARRTLKRLEAMNMIRKGQTKNVGKDDVRGQISFINQIFELAA